MKKLMLILLATATVVGAFYLGHQAKQAPKKTPVVKEELKEETVKKPSDIKPEVDVYQAKINQMTLEEKVGQMFMVRVPETQQIEHLSTYHIGGYIMFGRDFKNETKDSVRQKIKSYQKASAIPLLIGVDEEGGTVNRVSLYPSFRAVPFHSPQSLYQEGGWPLVISDTIEKSNLLKSLGINVNFAPVSDISEDPKDFMYARSFGKNADETSHYVKTVVNTMLKHGIQPVLKHFPGYGNNVDTHIGIAHDQRPYSQFEQNDFLPFEAGIESGAQIVLVSHNIVTSMDESKPASISAPVHRILRDNLNFDGVIITDDLVMDGVKQYAGDEEVAVQAVLAGNDLLCCTDFEIQIPAVIRAVKSGKITEERIDASVRRILKLKEKMGLLEL